jgi:hypothetical protein
MGEDVNLAHVTSTCRTACNALKRDTCGEGEFDLDLAVGGGDELLLVDLSGEILSLYRDTLKLSRDVCENYPLLECYIGIRAWFRLMEVVPGSPPYGGWDVRAPTLWGVGHSSLVPPCLGKGAMTTL